MASEQSSLNEAALLPCPFCGDDMSSFVPVPEGCATSSGNTNLYICRDCGSMGPGGEGVGGAIASWNQRAQQEATPPAASSTELPELPAPALPSEPIMKASGDRSAARGEYFHKGDTPDYFTADQMRAYARSHGERIAMDNDMVLRELDFVKQELVETSAALSTASTAPAVSSDGGALLALWKEVCDRAPGYAGKDKGLLIVEADLVRLGGAIESLASPSDAGKVPELPTEVIAALSEAISVCSSVAVSRDRKIVRGGCVLYAQTEEWCKWVEDEVGPQVRAAHALASRPAAEAQGEAVARIKAEVKAYGRICDDVGRSRQQNNYAINTSAVVRCCNKLDLIEHLLDNLPASPSSAAAQAVPGVHTQGADHDER